MTYVYMYRLSSDTGLAPCVENEMLSLACCKGGQLRKDKPVHTGLRYWIGSMCNGVDYRCDTVYVLGTYKSKFLYLARITHVVSMEDYFQTIAKGRTDCIYSVSDGQLVRNHHLRKEGVHADERQIKRDAAGKYVLLSDDYIYLGKDAVFNELVDDKGARFRETKLYTGEIADLIVAECQQYRNCKAHTPHTPFRRKCGD